MSNGNDIELLLRIRSIADQQGIQVTDDALEKIAKRIKEKQAATEEDTKTSQGATEAQKEQAQQALFYMGATDGAARSTTAAAEATRGLGHEMGGLRETTRGAHEVMRGFSEEGIGGVINVARGAVNVVRGLASSTIAGLLLPAVGAVGTAIAFMKSRTEENLKEMNRWWAESARNADAYGKAVERITAQAEKALAHQLFQVHQVAEAYADLVSQIDAAQKRNEALSKAHNDLDRARLDAQEQDKLAQARKAGRPQGELDKITQDFSNRRTAADIEAKVRDFNNAELEASVRKQNAERVLQLNGNQRLQAEANVQDAKTAFEGALSGTRAFAPDDPLGNDAREKAREAKKALDKAENNQIDVNSATEKTDKEAQATIEAANLTKEETGLRRQAYEAEIAGKASALSGPNAGLNDKLSTAGSEVEGIKQKIAAENDRATRSLTLGDSPDTAGLQAQLAKAQSAQDAANKAVVDDAKARQKSSESLKKEIQNIRDTSAT